MKYISNKTPRVSVVMPVFNVAPYIKEAVDSILNQTYSDFELIIIDDCSTDNTRDIIFTYSDPRIILIECDQKNGIANNLNIAIDKAKGEFIARMDGDDISLPTRIHDQVKFLDENPSISLCSCALKMFGNDDKVWIRDVDFEDVKISMLFHSPILHATSVFRKNDFICNNLIYNQNTFPAEDYDLWSRAVLKCEIVNIPKVLYYYRIHGTQTTHSELNRVEVVRKIRVNYLVNVFTYLSLTDAEFFIETFIDGKGFNSSNIDKIEALIKKVINLNDEKHFFNRKKLKHKFKRHLQNQLFKLLMHSKYDFMSMLTLLPKLRFSQLVKVFLVQFHLINPSKYFEYR